MQPAVEDVSASPAEPEEVIEVIDVVTEISDGNVPAKHQREPGAPRPIRLTGVQLLADHFRGSFVRERAIEVGAQLVKPQETAPAPAVPPEAVALDEALVPGCVDGAPAWRPKPLTPCVAPATEAELHPTPFVPLDGKPGGVEVPKSAAELTADWLTRAFRSRGYLGEKESVTEVAQKELGVGGGEFSELVMLDIVVDGEAPRLARHLVAKFSSVRYRPDSPCP